MCLSSLPRSRDHAVVVGGSIAGLLAARVLSEHFKRITIIERDRLPQVPEPRPGVPQGRQGHVLLKRGQEILEQLFPGMHAELTSAGAILASMTDQPWFTPAGWGVQFLSDLEFVCCSRSLLEWTLRQRVQNIANIKIGTAIQVAKLLPSNDRTSVEGVLTQDRHQTQTLPANLVVDASGRRSAAPNWLVYLGYPMPQETVINAHLGYATRMYKLSPDLERDWQVLFLQAAPPKRLRAGTLFPMEGDRVLVTLWGGDHSYPSAEEADFLAFARALPSPVLAEALESAEPLSPIYCYRGTDNRLCHYDQLPQWPDNFVTLGDAVCACNPVYGQGMTIAALGVMALDQCLTKQLKQQPDGSLTGMAQHFQHQLAQVNATPWMLATSEDYRYSTTIGGSPSTGTWLLHRYIDQVVGVATHHVPTRLIMLEVFNLIKPPYWLFHPRIVGQVLKSLLPAPSTPNLSIPGRSLT